MKIQTLEDHLVQQVRDMLGAEHQEKKALPRLADSAGSDELR